MKQRCVPLWFSLLFIVALILSLGSAGAAYTRPTSNPPTPADLISYGGNHNSVVVQVLNLTPYDLRYHSSSMANQTDRERTTKKSFLFAPVGIPNYIPGISKEAFDENNESYQDGTTHPYTMVFAWDDRSKVATDTSVFWTMKGVEYEYQSRKQTQDIDLGLWFYRVNPSKKLLGGYFPVVTDVVKEAIELCKLIAEPESPKAWFKAIMATVELAKGVDEFEKENTDPDNGNKLYIACYPVPNCNSCIPATNAPLVDGAYAGDGVDIQWASEIGGYPQEEIVVTTHLLRGQKPTNSTTHNPAGERGGIPIAMVTLLTRDTYHAAYLNAMADESCMRSYPAGAKIQTQLARGGARKKHQSFLLVRSLGVAGQKVLVEACKSLQARKPLTETQKELLDSLAIALEKGEKTLNFVVTQKGGTSHVR